MLISSSAFDCADDPLSTLAATVRDLLPGTAPAAPWACRCDVVMWAVPAGPATQSLVPVAFRRDAARLFVIGGFVEYRRSPVGPHRTVFAGVAVPRRLSPRVHVRLSASDSPTSVVGSRASWGIPATFATFGAGSNGLFEAGGLGGTPWSISAKVTPIRGIPAMPVRFTPMVEQRGAAGTWRRASLAVRGNLRPVRVETAVSSPTGLAEWLRPGRHCGMSLTDATLYWFAPGRTVPEAGANSSTPTD